MITRLPLVLPRICLLISLVFILASCSDRQNGPLSPSFEKGTTITTTTQTAQSVMIDIQGAGDFITAGGHQVWHFEPDSAARYFTASGGRLNQQEAAIRNVARAQRCTFWNGGTISGDVIGQVTVTPIVTTVDAQTAWTLQSGSSLGNDSAAISVHITVAGESYMMNSTFPHGKYSFSLRNSDGSSRVSNLVVTLTGTQGQVDAPGCTIVDGDAASNNCLADFLYFGNAGTNGTAQQYLISNQTMGYILLQDGTKKNDAGCPFTAIGVADPVNYTLGPGTYTVTVTGNIKGIDGNASLTFTGTAGVTLISAEGCR